MTVKISELKQKEVRKVITVMFEDNRVEKITVYNPTGEKRNEILSMMNEYSKKDNSEQEVAKELLRELTDLKVYKKDNIDSIISSPTGELLMVLREINEIKTELEYEFWTLKIMELNQTVIKLLTVKAMEKARHLHELSQELEISNVNTDDLEKQMEELIKDDFFDGKTI